MAATGKLTAATVGLRAYDVALGFRNLDERNAALAEFTRTHTTGMAALLAGTIKGRDIIRDAHVLKAIAAEVLKISPLAFDNVVTELAEVELVQNINRKGGEIVSFTEHIPLLHNDLHQNLGEYWLEKPTSEAEEQLLATVEILSQAPVPAAVLRAEIGASPRQEKLLTTVATAAELMQSHRLKDGTAVVTSPLCAFEQPDQLVPLFESHPADQVRDAFGRVRRQPGLPALMDGSDPVVETMIRLGLVPAPTVVGADKRQRAFVVLPYGLDPDYLTTKKQILDRALTIIACVRCGEVSGGVTPIRMPDRLLRGLMDKGRNYTLRPHSSTARQYAPLIRMGVIRTVPQGDLQAAQLVATPDNLEAVELARILLRRQGEGIPERGNEREAASLLFTSGDYLAPIETIGLARRNGPQLSSGELAELWEKMLGWRME